MNARPSHPGRWRRLLGVLCLASLASAACGDIAPESLAYTTEPTDTTILRIATPRIAGFEEVIDAWEREHPTVSVETVVRNIDDHHRSILDGPSNDAEFDLLAFDATYGPSIRAHPEAFTELRSIGAVPAQRDFLAARWEEGVTEEDMLIALPLDTDSTALLVRTDLVSDGALADLRQSSTWCDFLSHADAYSDATSTAFLASGSGFLEAVLSQSRASFVNADLEPIPTEMRELEQAWDLAMIAVGEPPLHGNDCGDGGEIQRIARNLPFDDPAWRTELREGGFAAIIAPWSNRRRIANAAPATAAQWTAIDLPTSPFAGAAAAGDGGLQLGVAANSTNTELAFDLLVTLTNPDVQVVAFDDGRGPLPAASAPHTTGLVGRANDEFFDSDGSTQSYSDAALARAPSLSTTERRLVIDEVLDALNKVQNGTSTPAEAWQLAVDAIGSDGDDG